MNAIRQLSRRRGLNFLILGVFVLWSGMFVCLLPNPAIHHGKPVGVLLTSVAPGWHSDCVGGKSQTFCKSEGRTGLLVNLTNHAGIDTGLVFRFTGIVTFIHATFDPPALPAIQPARLFLLLCAFLK